MPICSGKDDIGHLVLNDTLVSIPIGSEHFTNNKNKNNYEEELFKIEDQRYYYDQTLKCNQSIIETINKA